MYMIIMESWSKGYPYSCLSSQKLRLLHKYPSPSSLATSLTTSVLTTLLLRTLEMPTSMLWVSYIHVSLIGCILSLCYCSPSLINTLYLYILHTHTKICILLPHDQPQKRSDLAWICHCNGAWPWLPGSLQNWHALKNHPDSCHISKGRKPNSVQSCAHTITIICFQFSDL